MMDEHLSEVISALSEQDMVKQFTEIDASRVQEPLIEFMRKFSEWVTNKAALKCCLGIRVAAHEPGQVLGTFQHLVTPD